MTRVKLSPEYPYLTFRITGFDLLQGYRNRTLAAGGLMATSPTAAPQKGTCVSDLFRNAPEKSTAQKAAHMQIWLCNRIIAGCKNFVFSSFQDLTIKKRVIF